MKKRVLAILLTILIIFSLIPAMAEMPTPIKTIPEDQIPRNNEGQHHYLLLCTDQWDYNPGRIGNTDGILLLTMDTRAKRVMLTSFSRDILVERPDGVIGRITFITKNYGPEALLKILGTHFGVKVEKYFLFDMKHIENIIEYMGGVDIEVTDAEAGYLKRYAIAPTATKPSMDRAGTYRFYGHAAVIYMRIRKVGNGDYGRNQRIRSVLGKLADKAKNMNNSEAMDLLDIIIRNMSSTNMSMNDLVSAVGYALDLRGAKVEQLMIPQAGAHKIISYSGMTVMDLDYEKAKKSIEEYMCDDFVVID